MSGLDDIAAEARRELGAPQAGQGGATLEGEFIGVGDDPAATERAKFEKEKQEWAGVPFVLGGLLSKVLPELKDVYTMEACLAWGESMVPVARKYRWSMGGFELEAALFMATWGLASPTFDAIKKRRAANAKPKEEPQPAASGQPDPDPKAPDGDTHPDGSPKV
jgi:hypothetical protein